MLQTAERFIRNSELMYVRDESSYEIHSFVDWFWRCEIIKYLWIYAGNVKSVCIMWIDARRLKSAWGLLLCVKSVFCRFVWDFWNQPVFYGFVQEFWNQHVFCVFMRDVWISLYLTFFVVRIPTNPVTNKFGFFKKSFVFTIYNCSWNVTTRWELIFHCCLPLRGRNVRSPSINAARPSPCTSDHPEVGVYFERTRLCYWRYLWTVV